ncbi:hypothetical protein PLIIFM63780_007616 [Purpureocillium lilacinum]|uniref:Uncharacterized protein n=1 Tax=Purpureocillium lilacinum TaxID=33203 RepID=A0ACC4E1S8_PURLI|nr:hypothetical protein PLIIFM63780_007616 [Purpureocillium lilacinum]
MSALLSLLRPLRGESKVNVKIETDDTSVARGTKRGRTARMGPDAKAAGSALVSVRQGIK